MRGAVGCVPYETQHDKSVSRGRLRSVGDAALYNGKKLLDDSVGRDVLGTPHKIRRCRMSQ